MYLTLMKNIGRSSNLLLNISAKTFCNKDTDYIEFLEVAAIPAIWKRTNTALPMLDLDIELYVLTCHEA